MKNRIKSWLINRKKGILYSLLGLLVLLLILSSMQSPKPKTSALAYSYQQIGRTISSVGYFIYHSSEVSCKEDDPTINTYTTYSYDDECIENVCVKKGYGEYDSLLNRYRPKKEKKDIAGDSLSSECDFSIIHPYRSPKEKMSDAFDECITETREQSNPPRYKYSSTSDSFIFGLRINKGHCPDEYSR